MNFENENNTNDAIRNNNNPKTVDTAGDTVMNVMAKMQQEAALDLQKNNPMNNNNNHNTNSLDMSMKYSAQSKAHSQDDGANYWPIKDIPTRYKLYPEGTLITARPLKVLEVKKLSSINEDNADYVINDVLRRTVRGIEVSNLYLADKLYIIFWLRANTYRDSTYRVEYVCPKCGQDSSYHFDVDALTVNYIKDDYVPNKELVLENGTSVSMKYLTVQDEIDMERFIEINSTVISDLDREMLGLAMMLNMPGSLMEKYYFVIDGITASDFSYLNSYIKKYTVGIEPYMNVECKECGGTTPIGVTFRGDFFLPLCEIK